MEIAFVVGYEISRTFKFDKTNMLEYLSMMLCSVNNRFVTLGDPVITFKLVGVYMVTVSRDFTTNYCFLHYKYHVLSALCLFAGHNSQK